MVKVGVRWVLFRSWWVGSLCGWISLSLLDPIYFTSVERGRKINLSVSVPDFSWFLVECGGWWGKWKGPHMLPWIYLQVPANQGSMLHCPFQHMRPTWSPGKPIQRIRRQKTKEIRKHTFTREKARNYQHSDDPSYKFHPNKIQQRSHAQILRSEYYETPIKWGDRLHSSLN